MAPRMPANGNPLAAMVAGVWVTPAHLDDVCDVSAREAPDLPGIDCLLLDALAAQVAALGAHIALDGDRASPEAIREAVMTILADRSFAIAARRMAVEIAAANAPATAATWIETLVSEAMFLPAVDAQLTASVSRGQVGCCFSTGRPPRAAPCRP